MAVTTIYTAPVEYTGNGSTTAFPFGFKFFDNADLTVTLQLLGQDAVDVQTLGVDYTVTGAGVDAGGTVTMITAPPSGSTLSITRSTPATQPSSFQAQGPFLPKSYEDAVDRVTLIGQESSVSSADIPGLQSSVDALETTVDTALAAFAGEVAALTSATNVSQQLALNAAMRITPLTSAPVAAPSAVCATNWPKGGVGNSNTPPSLVSVDGGDNISTANAVGDAWTLQATPAIGGLNDVASNESSVIASRLVVAVGDAHTSHGSLVSSPDGAAWTNQSSSMPNKSLFAVDHDASLGLWCVVGQSGTVLVSATGTSGWAAPSSPPSIVSNYTDVVANDAGLIMAFVNGSGQYATTVDGQTWVTRNGPALQNFGVKGSVIYSKTLNLWVAAMASGKLYVSADCISWTLKYSPPSTLAGTVLGEIGSMLLALNANAAFALTTFDGLTWKQRDPVFPSGKPAGSVGEIIPVPDAGCALIRSSDGSLSVTSPNPAL